MKHFRERWFQTSIEKALKVMPVTVLTGPRQTGKTTLARNMDPARAYFTLDDLGILQQAVTDPNSLTGARPVTLDEVQREPGLFLAVKRAVDTERRPGDFLMTGSANLLRLSHVADSLAGRAIYLQLPPFCPVEWQARKEALLPLDRLFAPDFDWREWPREKGDWPAWLLRGGFPPALEIESDTDRAMWIGAYVQTYLERDLRQLSQVSSLPDFQRVMILAAHRTGRLLNQAELARDAALSHATTHRYVNLLETGCLISRIHPLNSNPTTSVVKAPKLVWTDCGLAAWLAGIKSSAGLAARMDLGFWLEQTLFQTFQTWQALDPQRRKLHFWRDRSGREVDFILEQDARFVALEIKAGGQVSQTDAAGIRAFRQSLKQPSALVRGAILHAGEPRPLGGDDVALPWGWMAPARWT